MWECVQGFCPDRIRVQTNKEAVFQRVPNKLSTVRSVFAFAGASAARDLLFRRALLRAVFFLRAQPSLSRRLARFSSNPVGAQNVGRRSSKQMYIYTSLSLSLLVLRYCRVCNDARGRHTNSHAVSPPQTFISSSC